MNLAGLTDSLAAWRSEPTSCPECGATMEIGNGLCLGCILVLGIGEDDLAGDDFSATLSALPVADTHWQLGNYEVLEEIGRGGMGVIYRARQRHSRRVVALKRVLSYHADSQETLARFRRETEAAASLDHPNILPIYEVAESEEGVPYFSMKYASGGNLREAAPALRHDLREIVGLMAKVARAVHYAHRQGILHRDLKPANILLDSRSEPLVSDFGLAKWLDASTDLTRTLTIFGTPGYIAPEQADGPAAEVKVSADVYSLGAILFDLIAGRPPFLGEHALAVIREAATNSAPKLRSLVKSAGRDLETICARCLEREPKARYVSAADLAEDLERWLEGRPIVARPVFLPARFSRWARRKPALAVNIAAVVILAGVALVRQLESHRLAATVLANQLATYSIASLPLLDLDTGAPDETLARTIATTLRDDLLELGPARVTPLDEVSPFWADTANVDDLREANRSSHCRTILTGSKRMVGNKLRISLRLLGAATGEPLLARSVETSPDPAAIRASLKSLAQPLHEILSAKDWSELSLRGRDPGWRDERAREFIVSGRQLMFRDGLANLDRSIRCLEEAIKLEPNSAIAHAYLAASCGGRMHLQWDSQLLARGEKEARIALALEPGLPDAHRSLAGVLSQKEEFAAAVQEQLRAIETGGAEELVCSLIGQTYLTLGQPVRALQWLNLARHWASRPGDYDSLIGCCWSELGGDAQAEEAFRRAAALRPEASDGWVGLSYLRLLQGNFDAARQLVAANTTEEKGSDTHPAEITAVIAFFERRVAEAERLYRALAARDSHNGTGFFAEVSYDSALGRLQQMENGEAAGLTSLREARERELHAASGAHSAEDFYRLAAISASLGEVSTGLDYFDQAIAAGWSDARSPRLDPRFDRLRDDVRFQKMLARLSARIDLMRKEALQQAAAFAANREARRPRQTGGGQ